MFSEDIRWIHSGGGESLPAASHGLSPKPGKKKLFFAIRDESRKFVICFVHTSGHLFFLSHAWPAPAACHGYCVNTVTLAWVGAPNKRTPFRIHDSVVGYVDRCLSRTRNLARFETKHPPEFFVKSILA